MACDESLLQRFQREARAASALNHPKICTIHGIEQLDSEHFIVTELLDGESLSDRIARGAVVSTPSSRSGSRAFPRGTPLLVFCERSLTS